MHVGFAATAATVCKAPCQISQRSTQMQHPQLHAVCACSPVHVQCAWLAGTKRTYTSASLLQQLPQPAPGAPKSRSTRTTWYKIYANPPARCWRLCAHLYLCSSVPGCSSSCPKSVPCLHMHTMPWSLKITSGSTQTPGWAIVANRSAPHSSITRGGCSGAAAAGAAVTDVLLLLLLGGVVLAAEVVVG